MHAHTFIPMYARIKETISRRYMTTNAKEEGPERNKNGGEGIHRSRLKKKDRNYKLT